MIQSLIPPEFKFVAYFVMALVAGGAGYWLYDTVYDRGYAAAELIAENTALAIKEANEKAIANASKEMREDVASLILEKKKLEDDVAHLILEAAQDPDAHSGGIKRNGVQRLNSVR